MEWYKAWANEPERPETQMLNDAAFRLWHDGRCYIARTESDGFIPETQLPRFGRHGNRRTAAALVQAGVWDVALSGWIDVRWEDEQRSAAGMEETRKRTAERVRRFRDQAGNAVTNAVGNGAGSGSRVEVEVREDQRRSPNVGLPQSRVAGLRSVGT